MTAAGRYTLLAWIAAVGALVTSGRTWWLIGLAVAWLVLAFLAWLLGGLVARRVAPAGLEDALLKGFADKDRAGVGELAVTGSGSPTRAEAARSGDRTERDVSRAPARWTSPPRDPREIG